MDWMLLNVFLVYFYCQTTKFVIVGCKEFNFTVNNSTITRYCVFTLTSLAFGFIFICYFSKKIFTFTYILADDSDEYIIRNFDLEIFSKFSQPCCFQSVFKRVSYQGSDYLFNKYCVIFGLQCFDVVGWAAGRASGL